MSIHTLNLRSSLTPQDYADLVEFAGGISEYIGWVVGDNPSRAVQAFLQEMATHVAETRKVSRWPGSERAGGSVTQHLFRANPSTVALAQHYGCSFSDWQQPTLPQDLHFLRADGTVVLGSISSEADAWLELHDDELARLVSRRPGLRDRVVRGIRNLTPDEHTFLRWLVDELLSSRADWAISLRSQLQNLRAIDGYPEAPSVLFVADESANRIDSPDGELPVYVEIADANDEFGMIFIWIEGGHLSGLDVSWWADAAHDDVFTTSRLALRYRQR